MRGSMNRRDRGWRDRKRALLRVMLLAAAPIMIAPANAESPLSGSQMLLPPLPLTKSTSTVAVGPQINPFCQPAVVPGTAVTQPMQRPKMAATKLGAIQSNAHKVPVSTLRLASGDEGADSLTARTDENRTTVRLLPLNIEPQSDPLAPNKAGTVRSNPMVVVEAIDQDMRQGTLHSVGNALPLIVPTDVTSDAPVVELSNAPEDKPSDAPSIELPDAPEQSPAVASTPDAKPPLPQLPAVAPDSEPAPVANTSPITTPTSEAAAKSPQANAEGPVSFSLDDNELVETSIKSMETPVPKGSFASLVKRDEATVPTMLRSASVPTKGTFRLSKATLTARDVDSSVSIARGKAASRTLLVPLPPAEDPINMSPDSGTEARIVKGARPRVDVGVPPVAIERISLSKSAENSPVAHLTSVVSQKPGLSAESVFDSATPTIVELKRMEVRALKVDGEIRKVQLGNSSVCAAVAAGSSQLQLIGAQDGVTRMAIWLATADGKDIKNVYEIRVGASSQSDASDIAGMATTLTKSARTAFPDSNIHVSFEKGQMIVEGTCSSNDSAKQALRMIRSACLMPVVDKLNIR